MDTTPNLALPYLAAAQSQKHVTHNEALRALDALIQLAVVSRVASAPPAGADNGVRYIIPVGATGAWAGHDLNIAAWQDGAWAFFAPLIGWLAYVADEAKLILFDGAQWILATGGVASVNPVPMVGVNATADSTNRLAVKSQATLLDNAGQGHQLKINKAAVGDTASVVLQDGYSGRAEIGLSGDDSLHVKVSADGSAWTESIVIDAASGIVSFPAGANGVQGPAGPAGPTGATGATGANGPAGDAGAGYAATSTTNLPTALGGATFTVAAGLAYSPGARVRATSPASGDYMEGIVSAYSGTSLTVVMDRNSGTATHAAWNINLAGAVGATGAAGPTGPAGPIGPIGPAVTSMASSGISDSTSAGRALLTAATVTDQLAALGIAVTLPGIRNAASNPLPTSGYAAGTRAAVNDGTTGSFGATYVSGGSLFRAVILSTSGAWTYG